MRVPFLPWALLAGACFLGGCSTPQEGSSSSAPATTLEEPRASANPPSLMTTQSSIPSASSSFPTAHTIPAALPVTTTSSSDRSSSAFRAPGQSNSSANADDSEQPSGTSKNETDANFDNIELVDASLKGKLAVLRVGSDPTDNNLLSVFVGLKNRTGQSLPLEVQTIYKDRVGNPMNGGSWIPITLKPHEQTEYRSTSISADAADFMVRIRKASATGDN